MDLSLKYRPKSFEEVIHQKHIVQSIKNAIKYEEIAPLYLFSGPQGTGKTSIARLIAMAACCQNLIEGDACGGECDHCKAILLGNYFADVNEINTAQYTKKGDADTLIFETINYQPMLADKKVYILDECHQLSKAAQQSLLKIFEEPPKNVIFILCTTEVNKVLSTIIDRSLHYEFKPIPIKNIFERTKHICQSEQIDIDDDAVWMIAKEANGSMRRPFKILNTVGVHDKITIDLLENVIGKTNIQAAIDLLVMICDGNRFKAVNFVDNIISSGKNIESVFLEVMDCFIDVLKLMMDKNCIISKSESSLSQINDISGKIKKGDQIINALNALDIGIKQINNSYASVNVLAVMVVLDVIKAFQSEK